MIVIDYVTIAITVVAIVSWFITVYLLAKKSKK